MPTKRQVLEALYRSELQQIVVPEHMPKFGESYRAMQSVRRQDLRCTGEQACR